MALFVNPNKEYDEILTALDEGNNDIVYQDLIKKEKSVLDSINRVVNQKQSENVQSSQIAKMDVLKLISNFSFTWRAIFEELVIERRYREALHILTHGDRKIYLGIMIVLIAFTLFFIDAST